MGNLAGDSDDAMRTIVGGDEAAERGDDSGRRSRGGTDVGRVNTGIDSTMGTCEVSCVFSWSDSVSTLWADAAPSGTVLGTS
jgi:hypothetical protein